ncbi:DUF1697 domain-containing protein [Sinomonas halotolerans]|uniref:DUF1697 domain-containing protein n=1 Tax=Sinomonas halotolerans TaxID=1644133 RepID=A0ABU9WX05_9MICC
MDEYAVFLRGVNVGGVTLKMAEVREAFAALGEGVHTLLASGNIVLSSDRGAAELKAAAERTLRDRFGYDAWVVVLSRTELDQIVSACPYPADDGSTHSYVTLGSDPAALDALWEATGPDSPGDGTDERRRLSPMALAWRCPKGATLESPLSKATAKPKFKATTTTRNLRTLLKVQAAFG